MARQIDYYFSIQSPWAYIGHALFEDLARSHQLKVNYKPVLLVDLFSETGGLPLGKRHPARQRYRLMEMQRWRDKRGLNFHIRPKHWPFDVKLADGTVIAAMEAGHNPEPFLRRAFAGVWEKEENLADAATLTRLADEVGLPGTQLVERAATDAVAALYEQNRQDAIAADVFGSPAWVLDGEIFWGQDRIELLADALKADRKAYTADV
ncbi:2-hydroxychromene-2-carboxylate isomerase [Bradyrhizobium sp. SYSU BS000235]|jgi:2-hydroxychromene-2-carboxylate isomerase|uniref:2-hydroxychromene-2-carboxylate isomerase n=1 Tax=Bradyrhizobium sp. SYSU BS000235 TaxID=3411332 RepID=UPI003C74F570